MVDDSLGAVMGQIFEISKALSGAGASDISAIQELTHWNGYLGWKLLHKPTRPSLRRDFLASEFSWPIWQGATRVVKVNGIPLVIPKADAPSHSLP